MTTWKSEVESGRRYTFGQNWIDFIKKSQNEHTLEVSQRCLTSLLAKAGLRSLHGLSFLDIGSGSGVHSAAALSLGPTKLLAIDYDPRSVECTSNLLYELSFEDTNWTCQEADILNPVSISQKFDVVYSWGVLHHTGNVRLALANSSNFVQSNGFFIISLYYPTYFDWFWKLEKKLFSSSPSFVQRSIILLWVSLRRCSYFIKRKSFPEMRRQYSKNRGMDYFTDLYDWFGGYPYETISPQQCIKLMSSLGFKVLYSQDRGSMSHLISGCNEFVFQRL